VKVFVANPWVESLCWVSFDIAKVFCILFYSFYWAFDRTDQP